MAFEEPSPIVPPAGSPVSEEGADDLPTAGQIFAAAAMAERESGEQEQASSPPEFVENFDDDDPPRSPNARLSQKQNYVPGILYSIMPTMSPPPQHPDHRDKKKKFYPTPSICTSIPIGP